MAATTATRSKTPNAFEVVGALVIGGAISAIDVVVSGFALMVVWNWFVPFAFSSVPELSFGQAIGIDLVATVLFSAARRPAEEPASKDFDVLLKKGFKRVYDRAWLLGLLLLIGLIVHSIIA